MLIPQSTVLAHVFGGGFVPGSQLDVVQPTKPGVPDWPAATPHLVAQPVGSVRIHVPKSGANLIIKDKKSRQRHGHDYHCCIIKV